MDGVISKDRVGEIGSETFRWKVCLMCADYLVPCDQSEENLRAMIGHIAAVCK